MAQRLSVHAHARHWSKRQPDDASLPFTPTSKLQLQPAFPQHPGSSISSLDRSRRFLLFAAFGSLQQTLKGQGRGVHILERKHVRRDPNGSGHFERKGAARVVGQLNKGSIPALLRPAWQRQPTSRLPAALVSSAATQARSSSAGNREPQDWLPARGPPPGDRRR